jgi:hypothetical protein
MLSLSFFRMTSILQGVYARSLQGNASQSDQSQHFGQLVPRLAELATGVLQGKIKAEGEEGKEGDSATSPRQLALQSLYDPSSEAYARSRLSGFKLSDKFWELHAKLRVFMDEHIYPHESTYFSQHASLSKQHGHPWVVPPIVEELKQRAKDAGLWNLFLTLNRNHPHQLGPGLTNLEYAPLCEIMGRSFFLAPEVFNCNAPDTVRGGR